MVLRVQLSQFGEKIALALTVIESKLPSGKPAVDAFSSPAIYFAARWSYVPGLTKVPNAIQIAVLIALSIITTWMLYMVPSWQAAGDPFLLATIASAVTVACLWLARWLGSRAVKFERAWLAAFLVGMPLVYVLGWFAAGARAANSWIWVELLGLALFATFAALGLKTSPWFLAIGIAGHGLAWDSWHYKDSVYIPDWYAVACLLVDLALGAYLVARIPAYRQAQ